MLCSKEILMDIEGEEIECLVEFDYTPKVDGVYHSAPENCYPDEPEIIEPVRLTTVECECDLSGLFNFSGIYNSVIERIEED